MARVSLKSIVVMMVVALGAVNTASAKTYRIDPVHSAILFKVQHKEAGFTYGRFLSFSGKIAIDEKKTSVKVEADAASVFTASRKRDAHLKGPDFLNAKLFPKITFVGVGIADKKGIYLLKGKLTLHGVSKEIELRVFKTGSSVNKKKELLGFEANFEIDRTQFGIKKLVGPVGRMISITVAIEAVG